MSDPVKEILKLLRNCIKDNFKNKGQDSESIKLKENYNIFTTKFLSLKNEEKLAVSKNISTVEIKYLVIKDEGFSISLDLSGYLAKCDKILDQRIKQIYYKTLVSNYPEFSTNEIVTSVLSSTTNNTNFQNKNIARGLQDLLSVSQNGNKDEIKSGIMNITRQFQNEKLTNFMENILDIGTKQGGNVNDIIKETVDYALNNNNVLLEIGKDLMPKIENQEQRRS